MKKNCVDGRMAELQLCSAWLCAAGMCTFWLLIGIWTGFEVSMIEDSIRGLIYSDRDVGFRLRSAIGVFVLGFMG